MACTAEKLYQKYHDQHPGTLEEYGAILSTDFVRSQVQLALARYGGTGHRYNPEEALDVFPVKTLLQVVRDGYAPLIPDASEPSKTLLQRREDLNVDRATLARHVNLNEEIVANAETPGKTARIREITKLAQYLGLDDRLIGMEPAARGDAALGVRLRTLAGGDANTFTPRVVLSLAEAAWVVSRQVYLSEKLGFKPHSILSESKWTNYNYPTWEQGYVLAERTRLKLGLYEDVPIESLRGLIEDKLGIPLIQLHLPQRFAGATISNGSDRGIVVNEEGQNKNVCVRRMTMCHELGHLLWDPDERLDKLAVDEYDAISEISYRDVHDTAEIRANAFAVAFLAPRSAIKNIYSETHSLSETVCSVAEKFRISATASRNHVANILNKEIDHCHINVPPPSRDWLAAENLIIDFFPLPETSVSRRGRFSRLVAKAWTQGIISTDSAALLLECKSEDIADATRIILEAAPI